MPRCMICDKELKFVNPLHLKTHGITMAEYRNQFPSAGLQEPGYLKGISRRKYASGADKGIVNTPLVTCLICNRDFRQITNTHLRTHNLTLGEYKKLYPDAKLLCDDVIESKRRARRVAQNSEAMRQWVTSEENTNRLRKMAKGAGIKAGKAPKTRAHWEKVRAIIEEERQEEIEHYQEYGVQCLVCGGWFARVSNTHLELHGMTCQEYLNKFPGAEIDGQELRIQKSDRMRNLLLDPDMRQKWSYAAKIKWEDPIYRSKMAEVRAHQAQLELTSIERILYSIIDGLDVECKTQVPIDGYIVDALVEGWLILEAYGDYWHNYPDGREHDRIRSEHLEGKGFQVLPFWGHQLRDTPEGCADRVSYVLDCT